MRSRNLPSNRVLAVPSPGPGRCIIVRDIILRKHGEEGVPRDQKQPRLSLSFIPVDGGKLPTTGNVSVLTRSVIFRPLVRILKAGEHGLHIETGMIFSSSDQDYPIMHDSPLTIAATYGGTQWAEATDSLTTAALTFIVRYEIMQIVG